MENKRTCYFRLKNEDFEKLKKYFYKSDYFSYFGIHSCPKDCFVTIVIKKPSVYSFEALLKKENISLFKK